MPKERERMNTRFSIIVRLVVVAVVGPAYSSAAWKEIVSPGVEKSVHVCKKEGGL